MVRCLHLAHDHVSVRRLRQQLSLRQGEDHQWVVTGAKHPWEGAVHVAPDEAFPPELIHGDWDLLVVHRLRHPTPKWLLSFPEGPMVFWATWGDDYYRVFPALSRGIYLPATRAMLGLIGKFSVSALGALQRLRSLVLPGHWKVTPRDWELTAMARVHGVASIMGQGFIALPLMPGSPSYFCSSFYNSVPQDVPEVEASRDPMAPILVGSSAATTGNQLDFLWKERGHLKASGREVRLNLAYGSRRYAVALKRLASVILKGQLSTFEGGLPLQEYYRFLAESSVVVHNQIRNQNTGNVVLSFVLGHRVLLRSDGFLYGFYKGLGFYVFDATTTAPDLGPLPEKERAHNRELAFKEFGDEAVHRNMDSLMVHLGGFQGKDLAQK